MMTLKLNKFVFCILYSVFIAFAATHSYASKTVYQQSLDNNLTSFSSDSDFNPHLGQGLQILADDFVLDKSTTITDVHWHGIYHEENAVFTNISPNVPDDFTIRFYNEDQANLGFPAINFFKEYNQNNLLNFSRISTGLLDGFGSGRLIYKFDVDLDTGLLLTANTPYFIEIFNKTSGGSPETGWSWSGSGDFNNTFFSKISDPGTWLPDPGGSRAFSLTTVPASNPAYGIFLLILFVGFFIKRYKHVAHRTQRRY